jgi:hypothetical protein
VPKGQNPLNGLWPMNESMQHMAFELPAIAFDLHETRICTGDAAVYVKPDGLRRTAEV